MMFPPPFLQPADPRLLTLTNSLFVDPTALLAPSPLPWSVPVSALGFPLVLTLQGALLDTAAPAGLSLSNVVILRVQ